MVGDLWIIFMLRGRGDREGRSHDTFGDRRVLISDNQLCCDWFRWDHLDVGLRDNDVWYYRKQWVVDSRDEGFREIDLRGASVILESNLRYVWERYSREIVFGNWIDADVRSGDVKRKLEIAQTTLIAAGSRTSRLVCLSLDFPCFFIELLDGDNVTDSRVDYGPTQARMWMWIAHLRTVSIHNISYGLLWFKDDKIWLLSIHMMKEDCDLTRRR